MRTLALAHSLFFLSTRTRVLNLKVLPFPAAGNALLPTLSSTLQSVLQALVLEM